MTKGFWNLVSKAFWYLMNLRNLCIACVRIVIYCVGHPKKLGDLFFAFFSTINEFYQSSHGHLYPLEGTQFYQRMQQDLVFAQCNVFNMETVVTRVGETQVLAALIAELKPNKIFEIGTYNGYTTLHFAYNTEPLAKIYTLDLPADYLIASQDQKARYSYDDLMVAHFSQQHINNRFYKKSPLKDKVIELFGNSATFDFTPYHGQMDVVFIDGNHSYSFVKADTENAFKMLSPNGVIIWHDFDYIIHRDVFKYLNELVNTHKIYAVHGTRFAMYGKTLV